MIRIPRPRTMHGVVLILTVLSGYASAEPLIRLRLSRELVESALTQTRHFRAPVREDILGAKVLGTSENEITIKPRFVPSANSIRIALDVVGDVRATTTSRKSAATVRSVSRTKLGGEKLVDFNLERTVVRPAVISASMDSQIVDFSWARVLGRSIAQRRANESKAASEAVSARKAAARTARQLDEEVNPRIRDSTRAIREQLVQLPQRLGQNGYTAFRTQAEFLDFRFDSNASPLPGQGPEGNLGGKVESEAQENDLYVEVSEQLLNGWAIEQLGGKSFSSDSLDEFRETLPSGVLGARATAEREEGKPRDSWSFTLANPPLEAHIDNQQLILKLRIESMTRDKGDLPAMNVTASYRLEREQADGEMSRWLLRRDERLNVELANTQQSDGKRGVREQVFRSTARRRLSTLVPSIIRLNDLLPEEARPFVNRLRLRSGAVSMRDGRVIILANN